ncbi:MAG TPA: signal peptide peptidase SppA [Kiritimatiellia bacterium]|nr:signal peptide peptidase SppA [Kiritimatiellia bacterium]
MYPAPPRHCRHWPFWVGILMLGFVLGLSLLLNLAAVGILVEGAESTGGEGEDEYPQFTETHSYGAGTTKVVRIGFSGVLTRELDGGWLGSSDPIEECQRQIRAARQDKKVAAIIFEVDSPGGEVTAADDIYRELTLFKESREDRKLVVLVRDYAASGGYYISLPADHIVAQPTATIGSIGVLLQTYNVRGLSEKLGVTDTTIKSGRNKDMLNPFQPVDPEQVALLQGNVDAMYERFLGLVATARGVTKNKLRPLADGRIFTADEALKHKLIDSIGYWDEACATTADLLGVEELRVVAYESRQSLFNMLFSARMPLPNWRAWLHRAATPRIQYLWQY